VKIFADWVFKRLENKTKPVNVKDKYYVFVGGIQSFLQNINLATCCNVPVKAVSGVITKVDVRDKVLTYTDEQGSISYLKFGKCFSTMDLRYLIKSTVPKINCNVDLKSTGLFVWDVVFNKRNLFTAKPHWVYYDGFVHFHHIVFPSYINPGMVRLPFEQTSLQVEFAIHNDRDIEQVKDYIETGKVYEDLSKVGIKVNKDLIDFSYYDIIDPAYTVPIIGQEKEIFKLKEDLKRKGVYSVGRFGGWAVDGFGRYRNYLNMADCVDEAYKLVLEI